MNRPNRFLVTVKIDGRVFQAHCPNPGRLRELLLPGVQVALEIHKSNGRKTRFTLAGVYYKDRLISLVSTRTNLIAEKLIIPRLFPEALAIEREVQYRGSRFDFRITLSSGVLNLEVKGCTLVEHGTALFPDAPTLRGLKHLNHLAEGDEIRGAMLFVIMQPDATRFMPNIHTDPDFSRRLIDAAGKIGIHAASVDSNLSGEVWLKKLSIPVDLSRADTHLHDGGAYLLVLRVPAKCEIQVGALGSIRIEKGFYVYVGSAARNLRARISRHKRQRKIRRWHIDCLLEHTAQRTALPIRSSHRLECPMADALLSISNYHIPGFGCSDCSCPSHLVYLPEDPLQNRAFLDVLLAFRHKHAFAD